jgi:hypothetical protein
VLMEATQYCSLGQFTTVSPERQSKDEVWGQYRRNM